MSEKDCSNNGANEWSYALSNTEQMCVGEHYVKPYIRAFDSSFIDSYLATNTVPKSDGFFVDRPQQAMAGVIGSVLKLQLAAIIDAPV